MLTWGGRGETAWLRRLQLAAETGRSLALLFRGPEAARQHSPAALRLAVRPAAAGMEVAVLKQRGGRAGATLELASWDGVFAASPPAPTHLCAVPQKGH